MPHSLQQPYPPRQSLATSDVLQREEGRQEGVAAPVLEDDKARDEVDDDGWGELFEGLDKDEVDSGPIRVDWYP